MTFRTRSLAVASATVVASTLLAASPAAAQETCGGQAATIVSDAAVIRGTEGVDVIVAGAGNNRIEALGGNDLICSRAGDDEIIAGELCHRHHERWRWRRPHGRWLWP